MDLRSYGSKDIRETEQEKVKEQTQGDGGMNEAEIRRAVKQFEGMSNNQLMTELAKLLSAKRARGEQADIEKTVERIKPFLNDEQRVRMEEIIGGVKR